MGASTIAATPSADITALSTEVLEAEVVGLAGRIAAANAQLLGLIAELDRRSRPDGTIQVRHPAGWLLEPSPPVPPPAGMPLPAVARQDALRATWAGERFDLDLAVGSTRWAQLREGALSPVLPPGVSAATSCQAPVP